MKITKIKVRRLTTARQPITGNAITENYKI
jgi:hypothetical protein